MPCRNAIDRERKVKAPAKGRTQDGMKEVSPTNRLRRRSVLGVCGTAHFLHDGFSDVLYIMFPLWAETFGLSLAQVGLLKAVYSGSLAVFQVPAGLLSERFGQRFVLATGTVVTGFGFVFLGFTQAFVGLLLLLFIAGLGSGTQHPLSSALVAKAYEAGPKRAALGTYNFAGDLGKVAIVACMGVAISSYGWRASSVTYGAVGIIGGLAFFAVLRRLGFGAAVFAVATGQATHATSGWGIHNPRGFLVISAIHMIDSAVRYGLLTFLPFLLIEKGADVEVVGLALALVFGGGAAGKLMCGLMAERLGIIRTAAATEILTGAGILALILIPWDAAIFACPLVGFALNGTSSVLYGTVADFVATERHSRSFGLFYTVGIGAGAVSPVVLGIVSDLTGTSVALAAVAAAALTTLPLCQALSHCMAGQLKRKGSIVS